MTAIELANEFITNTSKMEKYHQAINLLRESGFETVLRRLGEPSFFALDHPQHQSISAFEHAEKRGWFQSLDFVFDFVVSIEQESRKSSGGDFGAMEKLRSLGYSDELIKSTLEEEGNSNA